MKKTAIPSRIRALAYAAAGCRLIADIGTDHCLLPVFMLKNGLAEQAIASDVNRGPLLRAAQTIAAADPDNKSALRDRIELVLTDGLTGIEEKHPDAIVIAGMGGELIISILDRSVYVRQPGIRLILQPMTKSSLLRSWLAENGFALSDEELIRDGRIFEIITAVYEGSPYTLTEEEAHFGPCNLHKGGPLLTARFAKCRAETEAIIRSKESAGLNAAAEKNWLTRLDTLTAAYTNKTTT